MNCIMHVLGSELWKIKFDGFFSFVKECVDMYIANMNVYTTIMIKDQALVNSILSLHMEIWLCCAVVEGQRNDKFSQNSKLGHSCDRLMKGKFSESQIKDHVVHLGINVSISTHNCGCVVDGHNALMTELENYYYALVFNLIHTCFFLYKIYSTI